MLFLAFYVISAVVWLIGIFKLQDRYEDCNFGVKDRRENPMFYVMFIAIIPFVNSIFAVLVWVEYFYGEDR